MYVTTSIKMKAKERKILDFVQTCVDERFVTNQSWISKILNAGGTFAITVYQFFPNRIII